MDWIKENISRTGMVLRYDRNVMWVRGHRSIVERKREEKNALRHFIYRILQGKNDRRTNTAILVSYYSWVLEWRQDSNEVVEETDSMFSWMTAIDENRWKNFISEILHVFQICIGFSSMTHSALCIMCSFSSFNLYREVRERATLP